MSNYVTAEDLYLSIRTDGRMYERCCDAARVKGHQARQHRFAAIVNAGWLNYKRDVNQSIIESASLAEAARMLESDMLKHVKELDK